jgi:hypothetical protein
MAISNNLLLSNVSGQIGKQLVFKQYGDKTVVSKFPDMSKRKLTAKQLHYQQVMEDANDEVRGIMADDTLRNEAQIRLNVTRNKLYHALIKEYFAKAKESEAAEGLRKRSSYSRKYMDKRPYGGV